MKPDLAHRFSNRSEIREEVQFLSYHDNMPPDLLNLPICMALKFAIMVEIKSAIKQL